MLDLFTTVNAWLASTEKIALAVVVETWGSAPRPVGAKLLATTDYKIAGSVSGGCVENAVIEAGLQSIRSGQPQLLHFGVSDETALSVGLACGGELSIYVELLDQDWWWAAQALAQTEQEFATLFVLSGEATGAKLLVDCDGCIHYETPEITPQLRQQLLAHRWARRAGRVKVGVLDVLVDVYQPKPRLVIVGGSHVATALETFATAIGFRVLVVDPRAVFASVERFPQAERIIHQYPTSAFSEIGLDANTYIAVLSHDPKIDDPAVVAALNAGVPYIGILSSRKTHSERVRRLAANGIDATQLQRLRVPVGLDIGAQTPEEIALAIMAEIVAVRNNGRLAVRA